MSITLTITGDDAKFPAVIAALAVTAVPATGAASGGATVAPAFTPSINGTVVPAPPQTDQVQTGFIIDAAGNKFSLIYEKGAEFPYLYVNLTQITTANQLVIIDATVGPSAPVSVNAVVYVWDLATLYKWSGGALVAVTAIPANPNPDPPIMGIVAAPVVPPPAGSVVTGAAPVTATATGMVAAISAAVAGATVTLSAGVYTETCAIAQPITLNGAGIGATTLNCTGLTPNQQKAVLVPSVAGITISDLSITGSAIPDGSGGNAAGVRDSATGIGFALKTVEIFGCQDGVLTFASPIVIDGSHIHDNGNATNAAGTHNIYCGGGTLTLTNSIVEHCTHEHEVKSRATDTTITGCTIRTGGKGKCVDIPDAGNVTIANTTLMLTPAVDPSQQDRGVFCYGEESAANVGRAIAISNVVIDTTLVPGGALLIIGSFAPDAKITMTNVTYKGDTAPSFQGANPANITGTITAAA
jgi:hypothetical protein